MTTDAKSRRSAEQQLQWLLRCQHGSLKTFCICIIKWILNCSGYCQPVCTSFLNLFVLHDKDLFVMLCCHVMKRSREEYANQGHIKRKNNIGYAIVKERDDKRIKHSDGVIMSHVQNNLTFFRVRIGLPWTMSSSIFELAFVKFM